MPSMGRKQIQDAFEELSNELRSQRIKEHLYIVGGAAIAMAFRDSRHTFDIDALMLEGHGPVFDASRRIARRNGWPERWLNEAAVAAIPLEPDRRARTVYASSNLVVSAASPQHLLAMKVRASRQKDVDDILLLVSLLKLKTVEELLAIHDEVFSRVPISPRALAGLKRILKTHWLEDRPSE